jgi:hypothetical protein
LIQGAREFRQILARPVRRRDQGGAGAVARSDEDRESFLRKRGFSKSETAKIVETVLSEEDTKPQSIFDFVAGHHGARSQQDPSGRPPRIGGQGQETVGARRLTERAARQLMPRGSPSA